MPPLDASHDRTEIRAMAKHLFTFPCPCCNKLVEVDTRTGKARAVRSDEAHGGRDLDSLLSKEKEQQQRLENLFSSAKEGEAARDEHLERQLRRAKEEAKKDKDDKPRNIFDLD
jgi:hypothetical protein